MASQNPMDLSADRVAVVFRWAVRPALGITASGSLHGRYQSLNIPKAMSHPGLAVIHEGVSLQPKKIRPPASRGREEEPVQFGERDA
jgi:hypothetical protein